MVHKPKPLIIIIYRHFWNYMQNAESILIVFLCLHFLNNKYSLKFSNLVSHLSLFLNCCILSKKQTKSSWYWHYTVYHPLTDPLSTNQCQPLNFQSWYEFIFWGLKLMPSSFWLLELLMPSEFRQTGCSWMCNVSVKTLRWCYSWRCPITFKFQICLFRPLMSASALDALWWIEALGYMTEGVWLFKASVWIPHI